MLLPLNSPDIRKKVERHIDLLGCHSPTGKEMEESPGMLAFQAPKYGLAKGNWGYLSKDKIAETIERKNFEDKLVGPAVTAVPPDFSMTDADR
jgi:hypothetical protein